MRADLLQFPDDGRDAYWDGDSDIPDLPPHVIHSVVIRLNPDSRDAWEQTRHITGDEREEWDQQRISDSERAKPSPTVKTPPVPRFEQWGYPI